MTNDAIEQLTIQAVGTNLTRILFTYEEEYHRPQSAGWMTSLRIEAGSDLVNL